MGTNVDVTRRHHSPFVVRGPRLAPHATNVSGASIAPRTEAHAGDDHHRNGDERRRHEQVSRARPEQFTKLTLGLRFGGRELQGANVKNRDAEVALAILRRRQSERETRENHKQENEGHVEGKLKTYATLR